MEIVSCCDQLDLAGFQSTPINLKATVISIEQVIVIDISLIKDYKGRSLPLLDACHHVVHNMAYAFPDDLRRDLQAFSGFYNLH
jgi:type IV secretory pathway protease TraF